MIYSHSRLAVYEGCPRQFSFQYVERVRVEAEPEPVARFLGSRVHTALERLYRAVMRGRVWPLPRLLGAFRRDWRVQWTDAVVLAGPDDTPEQWRERGEQCLADYYRRHAPFDRERTVAVERRLVFPLAPVVSSATSRAGATRLQGIIDRLAVAPDGTWEVHDYKTHREAPDEAALARDRQLPLYQLAVQHAHPEAERVELVWHYVTPGVEIRQRRTPDELEAVRAAALGVVTRIEADREFAPRPGPRCDWCGYRPVCPAWVTPAAGEPAGAAPRHTASSVAESAPTLDLVFTDAAGRAAAGPDSPEPGPAATQTAPTRAAGPAAGAGSTAP